MTYCVSIMLDAGMIFASDSRTNAGVDDLAKFCKMTVFQRAGDRVIVLLSSGNLSGTQAVVGVLQRRCDQGDGEPIIDRVITHSTTLADAAKCVLVSFGSTMRHQFREGDRYFTALSQKWRANHSTTTPPSCAS